jgi:hypothetical protein
MDNEAARHAQRVAALTASLRAATAKGAAPLGLGKRTSNLFRDRSEGAKQRLDMSDLCHLLAVDTETTGMSPADGHRLVEVACVPIVDGVVGEGWSSLVRPGRSIPPDAARAYLRDTEIPLPTDGAVNAYGHWFNLMNVVEGLFLLGDRDAVAALMPLTETLAASEVTVMPFATLPRAAAGIAAACAGAWDAAEAHFREGLAVCDDTPVHRRQPFGHHAERDMREVNLRQHPK